MVKRYYCDYCDKTYPYNTVNRKKHNEGVQHQTLRANYYSNFKTLKTEIEEEIQKKPCFKHFVSSNCIFQAQCRSSHKSLDELKNLVIAYQSEIEEKRKRNDFSSREDDKKSKKVVEKTIENCLKDKDHEIFSQLIPKFRLPEQLRQLSYLPPSLVPPNLSDFLNSTPSAWG